VNRFSILMICYAMVVFARENSELDANLTQETQLKEFSEDLEWKDFFHPPPELSTKIISLDSVSSIDNPSHLSIDLTQDLYSPHLSEKEVEKPVATQADPLISVPLEKGFFPIEGKPSSSKDFSKSVAIDLIQVFTGAPAIYLILFSLSIASFGIWIYILFGLRTNTLLPVGSLQEVREKLLNREYEEALLLCQKNRSLFLRMVASGIPFRDKDFRAVQEFMKAEGKRITTSFWQKVGLLGEIAVIAPMLGLLGTVLGMFYAFYDVNRSMDGVSALFDGLGVSVGTTFGGLIVAILALIFHSTTKYRLTKQLTAVEAELISFAHLITSRSV